MKLFNKYKFSDKSQALGGLISTAMGILSLLSFGYGVYLSFKAAGEGGLRVGSLGILSLILAVIGTVIGLISFKEDNKFYEIWFNAVWGNSSIYDSSILNGNIILIRAEGERNCLMIM